MLNEQLIGSILFYQYTFNVLFNTMPVMYLYLFIYIYVYRFDCMYCICGLLSETNSLYIYERRFIVNPKILANELLGSYLP